jgi:protoporphyrinogen oxidase
VREAALAGGAEVWTRAAPSAFEVEGGRVRAVRVERPDGPARVEPGLVLSTIPLPRLLDLALGPGALAAERAALRFRPVRFLNLALARERALPTTWRYVGEGGLRAGRLQEPRRRSPHMAPPGTTSLMVEVPHAPGDEIDRADDAGLLARLEPELRQLGVPVGDALRFAFSVRAPEAYPVHLKATADARRAALQAIDGLANLRTLGRQGAFRFVFSDAAMRMGLLAAEGALGGRLPASEELAAVQSARELIEVGSLVGERSPITPSTS